MAHEKKKISKKEKTILFFMFGSFSVGILKPGKNKHALSGSRKAG